MSTLGTYEGFDVAGATVSVRNAGDGLSQALEVEAVKLDLHSTVHVVLECEVTKHTYEEIKDSPDEVVLVNVLKAGRATLIEREVVAAALDEQSAKIEEAKAAAEGQLTLGDGQPPEADAIAVLQEAEDTADWRNRAAKDLDQRPTEDLVGLAKAYKVDGADRLTKPELVDAILDAHGGPGEGDANG